MSEEKRQSLENLHVGQAVSTDVFFDDRILNMFIDLSGDRAPVHSNTNYAKSLGFRDRIVHGFLVGIPFSRLLGMELPGPNTVIQSIHIDMIKPVYIGDKIEYRVTVKDVIESVRGVRLVLMAENQDGVVVSRGDAFCIFRSPTQTTDEPRAE